VYKLAKLWRLALPLHPEYRTLAMVWKFQGDILAAAISERIVFWGVAGDLSSR
jgi:nitrate reductase beta subunit